MSYLRTNYRLTGKQIDADAIGRALNNWVQGSNVANNFGGGFMIGSHPLSTLSVAGIVPLSAHGMMSDYFGETIVARWGDGFRVLPVICIATYWGTASVVVARAALSFSGSLAFVSILGASLGAALAAMPSGLDVPFVWIGFIVSTPWS